MPEPDHPVYGTVYRTADLAMWEVVHGAVRGAVNGAVRPTTYQAVRAVAGVVDRAALDVVEEVLRAHA